MEGIKSFGAASALCCACKDGYIGKKAGDATVTIDLTSNDPCEITVCEKIDKHCANIDNGKCNLCYYGYKLDITDNACVTACAGDRYLP